MHILSVSVLLQFGLTALDVAKRDHNEDLVQLIEVRMHIVCLVAMATHSVLFTSSAINIHKRRLAFVESLFQFLARAHS